MIKTDLTGILDFIGQEELDLDNGRRLLRDLKGGASGYTGTGWLDFPNAHEPGLVKAIGDASAKIVSESAALVVVGIGGSYLGARAALEF